MRNKMAVEIATDVIAQLRSKRIKATPGWFFKTESDETEFTAAEYLALLMSQKATARCGVCALGALFVKLLERGDDAAAAAMIQPEDKFFGRPAMLMMPSRDGMHAVLSRAFSARELDDIETCFDDGSFQDDEPAAGEAHSTWDSKFPDDDERLAAIMLAVVRGRGAFSLKTRPPTPAQVKAALKPAKVTRKAR